MEHGTDWQTIDTTLLMGAFATIAADIETTKSAIAEGGSELNPLLGRKPSNKKLNAAGLLVAGAQVGVAMNLPKEYRRPFLAGMIGMEVTLAHQNTKKRPFKNFADAMKRPIAAGLIAAFLGHALLGDGGLMVTPVLGKVPAINLAMKF